MRGTVIAFGMLAVGIVILILTISSIGTAAIAETFSTFSIPIALAFILLALVTHILAAYRWQNILRALGHRLPLLELFQYIAIGYCVGYIAPLGKTGSAPARMLLIKNKGVAYLRGITSILIDSILENTFDVLFGIIVLGVLISHTPPAWHLPYLAISGSLLAVIGFFYARMFLSKPVFSPFVRIIPLKGIGPFRWNIRHSHEVDSAFSKFLRTNPLEIVRIFFISLITWMVLLLQYKLALNALGHDVAFFQLILIMVALSIAAITPVPAGVGVLELSQAAIFTALGLSPSVGVAFALLIRFRDFFITILGSSFLFQLGTRILFKPDDNHR